MKIPKLKNEAKHAVGTSVDETVGAACFGIGMAVGVYLNQLR
ncbi:hypothetical protein [Alteromonas stellipolaris]